MARPRASKRSNGNGGKSAGAALAALSSLLVDRSQFAGRAGLTFGTKRDLSAALGYAEKLGPEDYRERYERNGIADRIVETYPRGTWSAGVDLREDPDPENETPFEAAAHELFDRLDLWQRLLRADILAGLGRYSILLIGADGDLMTELPRLAGPESVLYATPRPESRARIESFVSSSTDPRFGLPETYSVALGENSTEHKVHWSRVLHVAEGQLEDDVYGKPRLRAVWNYLDDLSKVVGGGAEAALKRMDPGMQLDLDPEIELDAAGEDLINDEVDEYIHGLRRVIRTRGTKLNLLAATVSAFGSNADSVLKLVSASTGIPLRIFTGSERGELASSQDRANWAERIAERRQGFAEPLVRSLVDRLIEHGALPEPAEYEVVWPEIDELDEEEKARVAGSLASANAAQKNAEGRIILTTDEIRDMVLGLGPLEEIEGVEPEEPEPDPAADEEAEEEALRAAYDLADKASDEPEWKAVHRVADAHRESLARFLAATWQEAGERINGKALEEALARGDQGGAEQIAVEPLAEAEERLAASLPNRLFSILEDGAMASLASVRARGSFLRAMFSVSFDSTNPAAVAWAADRAAELVREVSPAVRAAIRELIATGIREGIPPRRLVRDIRQIVGLRSDQLRSLFRFIEDLASRGIPVDQAERRIERYARQLRRQRALLIARTEGIQAANEGQRQLWLQAVESGQLAEDAQRVWIITPDDRLDERVCKPMAGQLAGLRQPFTTPDGKPVMGPPAHPGCRCAVGISTPEDLEDAT